jgi:CelD/BcsL family acetyltransferase involved in cellulose biosynthesis
MCFPKRAMGEVILRIVVHKEIPEDFNLHRRWNQLALQMERPQVFYTCEWALALQAAYRAWLTPLLFLGYKDDDYKGENLVGVASLATDAAGKNVTFLSAATADYCDFLTAPQDRAEFVDSVFAELARRKLRFAALANLPEDSATPAALQTAAGKYGFHIFVRPAYLCAQVELGSAGQREQMKNNLAGKKKIRRYLREMDKKGPVTFVHLQECSDLQAALPDFFDAHVARFQATGRTSSLSTSERRTFMQELAKRFAGSGVVTLSLLKIGGRPVAWNYGFQFHGSWFWYQPTFDSREEENSPGHCLLSRIVMEACDMKTMSFVDLGLGAEGYKERFGNSTRPTLYVTLTKSRRRHILQIVRYRAASLLKGSPKLEVFIRRLLRRLSPGSTSAVETKNV